MRSNPHVGRYGLKIEDRGDRLVVTGQVRTVVEKDLAGLLARDAAGGTVENGVEIRR